ncbi:MAG: hypothetical protein Q4F67_03200 [Propionibacteriaceae bacterium]|nr:hypothetical protein [Propionibacteriaceae bacterium]
MSTPHSSTPWSPDTGDGSASASGAAGGDSSPSGAPPVEQAELVNEPIQRNTIPIKVMIVSLIALLITVFAVAFLATRGTDGAITPTTTPAAPEPTGPPVLPLRAGELAREPGDGTNAPDFGVDPSIQTSYAHYLRDGEAALIAVGARPVADPKALLDDINVRAQRQVGDGWCGREDSSDLDLCILNRNTTAVLTVGLRDQTPEEIMTATQQILAGTE